MGLLLASFCGHFMGVLGAGEEGWICMLSATNSPPPSLLYVLICLKAFTQTLEEKSEIRRES